MADAASQASNAPEFTVSELSSALKRAIEDGFGFVRVRGEVSGYRGPHSSGHVYFSLKDQNARLDAVIWKGVFLRMRVKPEEGMEVVATGKITTFPGKSAYQIIVDTIEPAGIGALLALLEARRKQLAAEGLFDAARKKKLPFLPRVIGVVTSPTGAVIRDILHRLADRFPTHVLVWPVRVQGETSAAEVAAAIQGFNALDARGELPRPDVIIVARGGGSLEDLWSFNEEIVVRAAAQSAIPLIAAVGHETDWTLIDYAADLRAPTPTAAAELATPVRSELLATLADLEARAAGAARRLVERAGANFKALVRALPDAEALLATPRQRRDRADAALRAYIRAFLAKRALVVGEAWRRLARQSPLARLARVREREQALGARLRRAWAIAEQRRRDRLEALARDLRREASRDFRRRSERLGQLSRRVAALLGAQSRRLADASQAIETISARLRRAHREGLTRRRARLAAATQVLSAVSYRSVLARGFALVKDEEGKALRAAAEVKAKQHLKIEFADGEVAATAAGAKPRKRAREDQATLF